MSTKHQSSTHTESDVEVMDVQIPLYRVVLYNDDYTTFEFVIDILIQVFKKSKEEAAKITLQVHKNGKGIAGTYPKEVADMKVKEVHRRAEEAGYPLRAGVEG